MLIIHLQHPEQHEFSWARFSGNAASATWKRGNWGEVSRLARRDDVVLLIPTRDVLLIQTTLVTTNQRQLKLALPYALEENLVGDPAEQHFVWQKQAESSDALDVAVINRETLKGWMAVLRKHKIKPRTILPDVFALPLSDEPETVPTIMHHNEQVLVRNGPLSGFNSAASVAPILVDGLFAEDDEEHSAWLYANQDADWHNSLNVLRQPQPEVLLQESIQQGASLNLLSGYQDASMSGFSRNWRRWRVAAVFALITLGILAGIEAVDTRRLQDQLAAEERENLALFKQVFPEITNIDVRSMRSRVRSEISLLQQEAGLGGKDAKPSPLPYMATVARTFNKEKNLRITEIRSRRGNLMIRFDSPSVELLEKLGQSLSKDLGFEPQIKSTQSGGGVRAELTLETKT
ncbi:MAG: type II secretion system protein GspL [Thiolinea sp.]